MPAPLRRSVMPYAAPARAQAVVIVNQLAVDCQVLQQLVYVAHHRVRGDKGIGLHTLFGCFAKELIEQTDVLTETVEQLGGQSSGTVEELAAGSRLEPLPRGVVEGPELGSLVVDRTRAFLDYCGAAREALANLAMPDLVHMLFHVEQPIGATAWKIDAGLPTSEDLMQRVVDQLAVDFDPEDFAWVRHAPDGAPPAKPDAAGGDVSRFGSTGADVTMAADGALRV